MTTTSTAGECCNVPHALNLFSSLEAAVSSLNLGGSVFLLTQHADALPRLELTELGLYLDSRLLHLTSNHRYACEISPAGVGKLWMVVRGNERRAISYFFFCIFPPALNASNPTLVKSIAVYAPIHRPTSHIIADCKPSASICST